jgi:hypothetical protein
MPGSRWKSYHQSCGIYAWPWVGPADGHLSPWYMVMSQCYPSRWSTNPFEFNSIPRSSLMTLSRWPNQVGGISRGRSHTIGKRPVGDEAISCTQRELWSFKVGIFVMRQNQTTKDRHKLSSLGGTIRGSRSDSARLIYDATRGWLQGSIFLNNDFLWLFYV